MSSRFSRVRSVLLLSESCLLVLVETEPVRAVVGHSSRQTQLKSDSILRIRFFFQEREMQISRNRPTNIHFKTNIFWSFYFPQV